MKRKFKTVHQIPEELGLNMNEVTLTSKGEGPWEGYSWGELIGRRHEDGTIQSFFKRDKEGAGLFEKIKAIIPLIEVPRCIVDQENFKKECVVDYFIQYEPVEHCSNCPTVTNTSFDTCNNVQYDVAYEVLFVDEDYRKYLVVEYTTVGPFISSMASEMRNIEDLIEELAEEKKFGFFYDEEGLKAYFYNDIGERLDISYDRTEEILDKIVSIRLIKLERTIIDRESRS